MQRLALDVLFALATTSPATAARRCVGGEPHLLGGRNPRERLFDLLELDEPFADEPRSFLR